MKTEMGKTEATNDDGDGDGDDTRLGKRKGEFPASKSLITSADRDKTRQDHQYRIKTGSRKTATQSNRTQQSGTGI